MAISIYLSITILNVNGFIVPIKRHTVPEWKQKNKDPIYIYLQQSHFRSEDTQRLKVRGWEKDPMQMEMKRQLG